MSIGEIPPYLATILLAWLCAHIIKYVVSLYNKEKYKLRSHLFRSGGMPSAHSAATVALATLVGLRNGIDGPLFAIALLFSLITMYDAVKVRRSSGEQGAAICSIIEKEKLNIDPPRIAKGHTPIEVIAGACLGILIGVIGFFVF